MNYYVETNFFDHDGLVTSGGKGRDDIFEMFRRCGLERIVIPTLKKKRDVTPAERLKLERRLRRAWIRALDGLGEGDVLFIHQPPSEKFMLYDRVISEVSSRGCRIVTVVFDLENYLTPYYRSRDKLKYLLSMRSENAVLRASDCIIAHNEKMKDLIVSSGIDADRVICLGVLDYLRDGEPDTESITARTGRELPLVFCGNLVPGKTGFLSDFPADLRVDLYGPGYEGSLNENIRHKGVYGSLELMDIISGSFGLVWDGATSETGSGVTGEYLRYNCPHKMSMYLASGLPVIVWDESAMADFVCGENCGFAVRSLAEVGSLIRKMTDDEYSEMRTNAIRVGNSMRQGVHVRNAVEEALGLTAGRGELVRTTIEEASELIEQHGVRDCKRSGTFRKTGRKGSKNALIVFTREPVPGKTKTRLMPYYTPEQCAELHLCFLRDISREMKHGLIGEDMFICYTGGEPVFLRKTFSYAADFFEQTGEGLGIRMENAISHVLELGYDKCVLIGTDIPEIQAETIRNAFDALDGNDIVVGPTTDGGYYLIGMKEVRHEAFDVKLYGIGTVYEETVSLMEKAGLTVATVDTYSDIDEREDIADLRDRLRNAKAKNRTSSVKAICRPGNSNSYEECRCPEESKTRKKLFRFRSPDSRTMQTRVSATERFVSENTSVSVIIPVYNESDTIDRMMDQLESFRDEAEIIFVDGGSTDDTAERIGGRYRIISSEKGRGVQMNAGAAASSGDILFFLHCDSELPPDFVEEIKRCMRTHKAGCFGVRFPSRNFFMLTNRLISNHRAFGRGLPFGDQGIFIDRNLFFDMGMFPEIPVMEDYEFSRRLRQRGIRPGMTKKRIVTSARRYRKGTAGIAATELAMWNLRRRYRRGDDIEELAEIYRDIR